MKKEKKSKNFLEKAHYDGGAKALNAFIAQHLSYPKAAKEKGIKGTVVIKYTINYKGEVIETKVISGIGHGCNEEAQRVVKLLKFHVGSYRNMKIQFHKTIKIHFHTRKAQSTELPNNTPTETNSRSITYTLTPTVDSVPKKPVSQSKKTPSGYNYTITIGK